MQINSDSVQNALGRSLRPSILKHPLICRTPTPKGRVGATQSCLLSWASPRVSPLPNPPLPPPTPLCSLKPKLSGQYFQDSNCGLRCGVCKFY